MNGTRQQIQYSLALEQADQGVEIPTRSNIGRMYYARAAMATTLAATTRSPTSSGHTNRRYLS